MQETPRHDGAPLRVLNCGWVGPNAAPLDTEELRATVARSPEYELWRQPLYEGKVLSARRTTAATSVRAIMTLTGAASLLLVPIRVGGQYWGHIGMDDCCGEREWSAEETDALRLLASVVGAAVTRERSLTEGRQRDALLQALTAGITDVLTADVVKEALPRVLESIGQVTRIDRMLVVEGFHRDELKPKRYYSWSRDGVGERVNLYEAAGNDLAGMRALEQWAQPLSEGKSTLASLYNSRPELVRLLQSVGLTSLLLVPITVRGRTWGSVSFDDCDSQREWRPDEINALQVFAVLIGAAITRERAVEQIRERDELLHAVTLSAGEIVMAPSLQDAICNSLERVARAVRADRMLVLEATSDSAGVPRLVHRNSWHAAGVTLDQKSRSTLVVPVMVDGQYWGQISFDACCSERKWTTTDTDILKTLASLIGTAIKRER